MAKFCTKCGKSLEEGMVCDCQQVQPNVVEVAAPAQAPVQAQASVSQPKSNNVNGFDFNKYLNDYLEVLKGVFVKPIDTINKFSESSYFLLAIIALVINCIISGVLFYCVYSETIGAFTSMMGGFSSLLSGSIEVPFFKTFMQGFIYMAAGFSVMALMIYVMNSVVFKDKVDIKKVFALVGTVSVFTTITTAVCIALNYISMKIMIVVLLLGAIFYLTYLYQGISEFSKVNKNKLAYVFVPSIAVATFVVVYVLPKLF